MRENVHNLIVQVYYMIKIINLKGVKSLILQVIDLMLDMTLIGVNSYLMIK